jgi:serine/threonine protein kinase/Tfp pilus assembly protein PilF
VSGEPGSDASQWKKIEPILDGALDLPRDERPAFLDQACAGDADLRAQVEELLHAASRSRGPLERTPDPLEGLAGEGDADFEGRRIGPYRIVRRIGEGGMGVVFEAEQETPRRAVALKLIRGGALVSLQQVRLFRREIEALARLRHSGIAAIHDAGVTDGGAPYFAMELVSGKPLDEFLAEAPLDPRDRAALRERLELFLRIGDAVSYAHQRGIIHRDLKPSNVLVARGTDPATSREVMQPKILDFGLARRLEGEDASLVTEPGRIRGTLAYMSPEQARGDPESIDVRSDVYSLGVMLYEMLTGRLPVDVRARALPDAVRAICEQPPVRPGQTHRALRGDPETILLKALEKDPERRYPSVASLADDVRRFLADQPILARSPSTAYQLRKLVARHRGAAAFTAVAAVLVIAFGATMSVMYRQQREATRRAEVEAAKAGRTLEFFETMLASVDPSKALGREPTVRDVLEMSASRIDSSFASDPEVRASIQYTIGSTYYALGHHEEASRQLAAAWKAREELLGPAHLETVETLARLSISERDHGDLITAEEHVRRALEGAKVAYGERSNPVASLLSNLGTCLWKQGKLASAESTLQSSITMLDSVAVPDERVLAATHTNLAIVYQAQGRTEEALEQQQHAVESFQRRGMESSPEGAKARMNLAFRLADVQRFDESVPLLREVLEEQRRILGADHPSRLHGLSALAYQLLVTGKAEEAEPLFREALERSRTALGPEHPETLQSLHAWGYFLGELRRHAEAEATFREAVPISRHLYGDHHPQTAALLHSLGHEVSAQGRRAEGLVYLREAAKIFAEVVGEDHPQTKQTREVIAELERGERPE